MKRFWLLLAFGVLISGCAATPSTPAPAARKAENATPKQEAAAVGAPAYLRDLALRDLVAAGSGGRFIVQDQAKSLYLVSDAGKVHLGAAPEIGLVAAWGQNDFGYAFARKADDGSAYEIVGVGHEGSKVLAKAVGYPGAMQFIGQELHYIDAEGWKVVTWSGAPTPSKVFPLLASELAFDAYGRLIAHVYPPDGSGPGSIVGLNLEDGSTAVLLDESA